jgi:biotin synthase-related radical SAM superfamily protein
MTAADDGATLGVAGSSWNSGCGPAAPDRGALCVARCGQAAKETAGLPVEVQFEPPRDLTTINQVYDMGVDALGTHVESFDPAVLARVAPGKFRTGIETYFRTWKHAVALFGEGRVSTYVILGIGEDPDLTVETASIRSWCHCGPCRARSCRDVPAPSREYTEAIHRKVAGFLAERGLGAETAVAGCARCQACSSPDLVQHAGASAPCGPTGSGTPGAAPLLRIGRRPE